MTTILRRALGILIMVSPVLALGLWGIGLNFVLFVLGLAAVVGTCFLGIYILSYGEDWPIE